MQQEVQTTSSHDKDKGPSVKRIRDCPKGATQRQSIRLSLPRQQKLRCKNIVYKPSSKSKSTRRTGITPQLCSTPKIQAGGTTHCSSGFESPTPCKRGRPKGSITRHKRHLNIPRKHSQRKIPYASSCVKNTIGDSVCDFLHAVPESDPCHETSLSQSIDLDMQCSKEDCTLADNLNIEDLLSCSPMEVIDEANNAKKSLFPRPLFVDIVQPDLSSQSQHMSADSTSFETLYVTDLSNHDSTLHSVSREYLNISAGSPVFETTSHEINISSTNASCNDTNIDICCNDSTDAVIVQSPYPLFKPDPNSVGETTDEYGLSAHMFFEITDKITQYHPESGLHNEILHESQFQLLKEELRNFLKSRTYSPYTILQDDDIVLVQHYTGKFPKVRLTVRIGQEGKATINVHDNLLSNEHPIWNQVPNSFTTFTSIEKLLFNLLRYDVCVGNYDQDMVNAFSTSGPFESTRAFKEGDFSARNHGHLYSSTIRCVDCALLVSCVRCKPCGKYRRTLWKKVNRIIHNRDSLLASDNPQSSKKPNVAQTDKEKDHKLKHCAKDIKHLKRKVAQLQHKLEKAIKKNGEKLNESDNNDMLAMVRKYDSAVKQEFTDPDSFQRVLWDAQIKYNSLKSKNGMRWHPTIIKWCIYMQSKGQKAYETLRKSIHLPSKRSLYDYTHFMPSKLGYQPEYVSHLIQEAKANGLYRPGRDYVGVLQDEIRIKEGLVYDRVTGELVGFVDLGNFNSMLKLGSIKATQPIAKNVLVVMVQGLAINFQYPLAAFATPGVTSTMLYPIIWDAVKRLEVECNLKVMCVTCDGATPNRKFFTFHGRQIDTPVYWTMNAYSEEERKIYFVSDVPHLIKTARNCFANSYSHRKSRKLYKNGKDISWMHLVMLYELYIEPCLLNYAQKLTRAHIDLTAFSQMKVNLAAQVFSSTVADAFEEVFGNQYSETVRFIRMMDRFFDCLNTRCQRKTKTIKEDLKPYYDVNDERFRFLLEDFSQYFAEWENDAMNRPGEFTTAQRNSMMLSKQTLDGFKISVNSIVECTRYMLNNGVSYVQTHKFNQDKLEEHFAHLRHKCGSNENPTVNDIRHIENVHRVVNSAAIQPNHANVMAVQDGDEQLHEAVLQRKPRTR